MARPSMWPGKTRCTGPTARSTTSSNSGKPPYRWRRHFAALAILLMTAVAGVIYFLDVRGSGAALAGCRQIGMHRIPQCLGALVKLRVLGVGLGKRQDQFAVDAKQPFAFLDECAALPRLRCGGQSVEVKLRQRHDGTGMPVLRRRVARNAVAGDSAEQQQCGCK